MHEMLVIVILKNPVIGMCHFMKDFEEQVVMDFVYTGFRSLDLINITRRMGSNNYQKLMTSFVDNP